MLNERIIGKKQLAFVIEDDNDEIFGYYFNTEIKLNDANSKTDRKSFQFNLQSKNDEINNKRFDITILGCVVRLHDKSSNLLIQLGNIRLYKDKKQQSNCYKGIEESCFYYGNSTRLPFKPKKDQMLVGEFTIKKFIVIQMK